MHVTLRNSTMSPPPNMTKNKSSLYMYTSERWPGSESTIISISFGLQKKNK